MTGPDSLIAYADDGMAMGEMTYLSSIPDSVPAGKVIVHNQVRTTRRLGTRGARAWVQQPNARLEICDCGWAPELPKHYRVERPR